MRKTSKLISLLLALGMLFSLAIPMQASAAVSFSDIPSDHIYYTAITNLAAEGIINGFTDGSFKPEDPVTRAQFTKIVCYALNTGDITYSESERSVFPDVVPDHWAINNIITAKNSNIINGYDDGTFKPENNVLYEQAVKMAVCALGYTENSAKREGNGTAFPNGYLKIANRIGLLEKIQDGVIGQPLSRGGVAQLMDTFRDTKMFDPETGTESENSVREETSSSAKVDGRIVSVYDVSMYYGETSPCLKNQIELECSDGTRKVFDIKKLDIADPTVYLGKTVTIFYEDKPALTYKEASNITLQANRNKEVKINLDSIENDSTNTKIKYLDEKTGKVETVSLIANIPVIHNRDCVNDSITNLLAAAGTKSGYLKLISATSERTADIAFLMVYDTISVASKSTTNHKIFNESKSVSFTLNEEDSSKNITFTKDGNPSNFSGIAVNNIVSVAQNQNGNWIDVQISSEKKTGTVEELRRDGSFKLTSGNAFYHLAASYTTYPAFDAGDYVTIYLDAFGKVGRLVLSAEKSFNYAYLSALESESTMSKTEISLMVYVLKKGSSTLKEEVYTLKENIKIDDDSFTVSRELEDIKDYLSTVAGNTNINPNNITGNAPLNATYAQPIRFTTTSTGSKEIDHILTAESSIAPYSSSLQVKYHVNPAIPCTIANTRLSNGTSSYSLDANIPIIVIPSNRTGGTYRAVTNTYFKQNTNYYVQCVNVSEAGQKPAAIYVYDDSAGSVSSITEDNVPMIVRWAGKRTHTSEDGTTQARYYLDLIGTDGTTMTVYDDNRTEAANFASIKQGDIIRVAADSDDFAEKIEIIATAESILDGTTYPLFKVDGNSDNAVDDTSAPFRTFIGLVKSADNSYINIAPALNSTAIAGEPFEYKAGANVYLVDHDATHSETSVRTAEFSDIEPGMKAMVYTVDGKLKAIIIFDEPVTE